MLKKFEVMISILLAILISPSMGMAQPVTSPDAASATLLVAQTVLHMPSGVFFIAPQSWYLAAQDNGFYFQDPDRQLSFVAAQSDDADGLDAIHDTWTKFFPTFSLAIYKTDHSGAGDKWDESVHPNYFVPDPKDFTKVDMNRAVGAWAHKKGGLWYVFLFDGPLAAVDRRWAQIQSVMEGLALPQTPEKTLAAGSAPVLDADKLKTLEDFIEQARNRCKIPGVALALVQNGKVIDEKGFGVKEKGKDGPVTPHTLFSVASMTKPLTTLLMARLVDEGKLDWDTPVTEVLPKFHLADPKLTQELTLRYTVCACAGLPRQDMDLVFPAQENTADEMLAKMGTMMPTTGFGETFQYSNQMVAVGGYVAAKVFDPQDGLEQAYASALKSEVFDPLGMTDSTLNWADVVQRDYAMPHGITLDLDYETTSLSYEDWMNSILPAAGVWSSADDMAKYLLLELSKGLGPDGKRLVSEKNLLKRREYQAQIGGGSYYGLGLEVSKIDQVTVIGHSGAASGYSTYMCFLPDQGVGLVLLANARGAFVFTEAVRDRLLELLTGSTPRAQDNLEKWDVNRKEINQRILTYFGSFKASQSWVYDYKGNYLNPDLGQVSLNMEDEGAMFDEGKWKAPMGAYYDKNGEVRFMLTKPPFCFIDFTLATDENGHKTLTYNDPQKKYIFEKVSN